MAARHRGVVPAVGLPDGMLTGVAALTYLAELAATTPGAGPRAAPAAQRVRATGRRTAGRGAAPVTGR